MARPWNKLRLAYSEPKEILRAIDMWDGERLLVIGDGSNGGYEWAIEKDGNVTQHSDCGYGVCDIALRDGLIAYHGMPQPDGWFMRTIKPRVDGSNTSGAQARFMVQWDGDLNAEFCDLASLTAANREGAPDLCEWAQRAKLGEGFRTGGGAAPIATTWRIS